MTTEEYALKVLREVERQLDVIEESVMAGRADNWQQHTNMLAQYRLLRNIKEYLVDLNGKIGGD
jgi:hypothetical protein